MRMLSNAGAMLRRVPGLAPILLAAAVLLLGLGVAFAQSVVAVPTDVPPIPDGQAQIVFLKPTKGPSGHLPASIFLLDGERRELLGTLGKMERISVAVTPGEHRFISHAVGTVHVMDARVDAGKRYYVVVRFIYGRGYQLRPVRHVGPTEFNAGNPEFSDWLASTVAARAKPDKAAFYAKYHAGLDRDLANAMQEWQGKSDAQRAELTLVAEDAL